MEENISVHGINSDTLKITCQEAICWGNSFKALLLLITPDPQTGKLQQDGLIFKVHIFLSFLCIIYFSITKCTTGIGDVYQCQRAALILSVSITKNS